NGISQMWGEPKKEEGSDQEDFEEFAYKQTLPVFVHASRVPPFKDWKHAYDLLQAAPKFQEFQAKTTKEARDSAALYFYHPDLESWQGCFGNAKRRKRATSLSKDCMENHQTLPNCLLWKRRCVPKLG
ncbi:MAG: hypothetical protein QF745_02410, partial [Planctomycetota bacterium]|nr:hypothetical protein [Planctomycetota bacterium]